MYIFLGRPNETIIKKQRGNINTNKKIGEFDDNGFFVTDNKILAQKMVRKFKYIKDFKTLDWNTLRKLASKVGIYETSMKKKDVIRELNKMI